jgi:hypothetical protein
MTGATMVFERGAAVEVRSSHAYVHPRSQVESPDPFGPALRPEQ